jgi:hypothetical protein
VDALIKIKNIVESEFILLGTERGSDGLPWALLASDRDDQLKFACSADLNPPGAQGSPKRTDDSIGGPKPPVRRQAAGPSHAAVAPTSTKLVTNSAYHERLSDSYSACNTVVVTGSS